MNQILIVAVSTCLLGACMLVLQEVGRRIGLRRLARDPNTALSGMSAIDGSVFGLFGLLVAFTFSGAATRFDGRRQLIVQEANNIGTAYLRLDLLPPDPRRELQELFRRYTDSRLETYRKLPDVAAAEAEIVKSQELQSKIWNRAISACQGTSQPASMLLLPALNDMIDITTTRTMTTRMHPPVIVFAMLFAIALSCALLAGYGGASSKTRSHLHACLFAAVTAVTIYVILDLEYPRMGLFRVDAMDQVLVDVRNGMR